MKISKAEILFMVALVLILTIICVAIVTTGGSAASLKGDTPTDVPMPPPWTEVPPPTGQPPTPERTSVPTHALHPSPYAPTPAQQSYPQPEGNGNKDNGSNGTGLPTELPNTGGVDKFNEPVWLKIVLVGAVFAMVFISARIIRWGGRHGS